MLTLTHNKGMYTVMGIMKDSENQIVHIGESTFSYTRSLADFEYYSSINGFSGKRVNEVPKEYRII